MSQNKAKLGKYDILRELGRGAMGVVYEALDPSLERRVALKTIRRDHLDPKEAQDLLHRFQREAKAAGRLNHPNIVGVYDYGIEGNMAFFAMELIHGHELKDYFEKEARFSVEQISAMMSELLGALEYSHECGVVHRDIKPSNIMIQTGGRLKVADFGIARIESSQYTQAGKVLGTPAYMSPEQFMGQVVDGRSDIFSAGIVFYQFLTGEKPFSGSATTIMHKVLNVNPPPPSVLNVQVPRRFDAIVAKAIAKRPEDRFQSAAEFAAAIQRVIEGHPLLSINRVKAQLASYVDRIAPPLHALRKVLLRIGFKARDRMLFTASALAIVAAAITVTFVAMHYAQQPVAKTTAVVPPPPSRLPLADLPQPAALPVPTPRPSAASAAPGTMIISAVGLADPNDKRYVGDSARMTADLQSDSKSQLVEKAIALYLDRHAVADNYDLLRKRLLSKSSSFIGDVIQEDEPQLAADGLMYVMTKAVVKVSEIRKSLNEMSRNERLPLVQNFEPSAQRAVLKIEGLPDRGIDDLITRELLGLQSVISAVVRSEYAVTIYDLALSGSMYLPQLVTATVLRPLNAKLAQNCFDLDSIKGNQITVKFDVACASPKVMNRLINYPPASLYAAPTARQRAVLKNPEAKRKLAT